MSIQGGTKVLPRSGSSMMGGPIRWWISLPDSISGFNRLRRKHFKGSIR
jgi:hypothetical protein